MGLNAPGPGDRYGEIAESDGDVFHFTLHIKKQSILVRNVCQREEVSLKTEDDRCACLNGRVRTKVLNVWAVYNALLKKTPYEYLSLTGVLLSSGMNNDHRDRRVQDRLPGRAPEKGGEHGVPSMGPHDYERIAL